MAGVVRRVVGRLVQTCSTSTRCHSFVKKQPAVRHVASTTTGTRLKDQSVTTDVDPGYEEMPVCSYNEWDTLEEIIVGRAEGQRIPELSPDMKAKMGEDHWQFMRDNAGQPHDPVIVQEAVKQVEEFCKVLELEGVRVRRPEPMLWDKIGTMKTPYFETGGYMNACPRDGVLVVGDEIIEAPMAWRSRVNEFFPYRKLFNEYFKRGAKWTAAPRPKMDDDLFDQDFPWTDKEKRAEMVARGQFLLTEAEPCFDAADALRFGKDIVICLSHGTNRTGVEWLRRHLAPRGYNVHSLVFKGLQNCHADATFMPLKPGVLAVCPVRPCLLVNDEPSGWEFFSKRGWDVVTVPEPDLLQNMMYVSKWVSMNVLSLDQRRVVMQKGEIGIKKLFISLGLTPIEVDMRSAFHLGGAFHCWTVDIKRRSTLQSYF